MIAVKINFFHINYFPSKKAHIIDILASIGS